MRILLDTQTGALGPVDGDDDLQALYAPPRLPWLRVNFVATVDGSATGADGLSGSINNAADKRVFAALRDQADVIVVGAGTVREEEYEPNRKPMVVVSNSGDVPPSILKDPQAPVLLATHATSPGLEEARALLGEDSVLVVGEDEVDLVALRAALESRGYRHILSEGGPSLFRDMLAAGVVDELDLTLVPLLVGGDHLRITRGGPLEQETTPVLLLEEEGTFLGRWLVTRPRG